MDTQYLLLVWFCCLTPFIPMFCCRNKIENRMSNCPDGIAFVNSNVTNKNRYLKRDDLSRTRFDSSFPRIQGSTVKTEVWDHHSPASKMKPRPKSRQVVKVEGLMWRKLLLTFQFKVLPLVVSLCAWLSIIWLFTMSSAPKCAPIHRMSNTKHAGGPTGKPSPVKTKDRNLRQLDYCHLNYSDSFLGYSHEITVENGPTHDIMTPGDLSLNSAFIQCSQYSNISMSQDVPSCDYVLSRNFYDTYPHQRPIIKTEATSYPIKSTTMALQREKDVFKDNGISTTFAQCNPQYSLKATDTKSNTETKTTEKVAEDVQVKRVTKHNEGISTPQKSKAKHAEKAVSCPPRWTTSSSTNRLDRKAAKCALPFPAEKSVPDSRKLAVKFLQIAAHTPATMSTFHKQTRGIVLDIDASEDAPEEIKRPSARKKNVGVIGERGDFRKLAGWKSCDPVSSPMYHREQSQNKSVSEHDLPSSFISESTISSETCGIGPQVRLFTCDSEPKPNRGNTSEPLSNHFELTGCCCEDKQVGSDGILRLFKLSDVPNQSFLSTVDQEISSSSTSPIYDLDDFKRDARWEQRDARWEQRDAMIEECTNISEELDSSPTRSDCKSFVDIPLLSSSMAVGTLSVLDPSEKSDTGLDNLSSPNSTGSESSQMAKFHNFCLRLLETSFLGEADGEETINPDIIKAPSLDENQQHQLLAFFHDKSSDSFRRNLTLSDKSSQADGLPLENPNPRMCLSDPEGKLEQVPLFCSMLASSCFDVKQWQNGCVIPHTYGSTDDSGSCVATEVFSPLRLRLAYEDDTDQAHTEDNESIATESTLSSTSAPAESFPEQDVHLSTNRKSARSKGPTKLPDVPMDMDFVYMSCKTGRLVPVKDFIRILESCCLGVDEKKDIVSQQYTIAREKCCLDWIEAIRNRGKRILPKWWLHRYMRAEGLESNKCRKRREWLERKQAQALEEERLREKKDLFFLGSRSDIGRYLEEATGPEKLLFNYGQDGIPRFQIEQYFAKVAESVTASSLTSEVKVDLNVGQPSRWTNPALNTPREDMDSMCMSSPGRSRSAGGEPREHPGTQDAELQTSNESQPIDRAVEDGSGDSFCEP